MSAPQQALRDRIAGRIDIIGLPLRRLSVCRLCGLDSGPWLTRQAAEVSSLLHLTSHHPEETPRLPWRGQA